MKELGQALDKFANGIAWVSFVGMASLMLLNMADVMMNKLTGQSILSAYEISQSTLTYTVFTSFAYGQVHKTHIHMTLFIERFPSRSEFIPSFLSNLLSIVLIDIMTYATFLRANHQLTNRAVPGVLCYSVAPFYYIEAVCMIVLAIVLLYDMILSSMVIFKGGYA